MQTKQDKSLSEVIAEHQSEWLRITGVVGCGETQALDSGGRLKPAIMIMVDSLTLELKARLPVAVEGYRVVVEEVGTVRPLGK